MKSNANQWWQSNDLCKCRTVNWVIELDRIQLKWIEMKWSDMSTIYVMLKQWEIDRPVNNLWLILEFTWNYAHTHQEQRIREVNRHNVIQTNNSIESERVTQSRNSVDWTGRAFSCLSNFGLFDKNLSLYHFQDQALVVVGPCRTNKEWTTQRTIMQIITTTTIDWHRYIYIYIHWHLTLETLYQTFKVYLTILDCSISSRQFLCLTNSWAKDKQTNNWNNLKILNRVSSMYNKQYPYSGQWSHETCLLMTMWLTLCMVIDNQWYSSV